MEEKDKILIETEQRSMTNKKQIEDLKDSIKRLGERMDNLHKIAANVEVIANKMINQGEKMDEIKQEIKDVKKDVSTLKMQPAEKWNKATWLVIAGTISFILGYFIDKIPQ